MLLSKLQLSCLFVLFSFVSFSQYTEIINTNRPGVSKGAFSVGTNVIQIELGGVIINEEHKPLKRESNGFGLDFAVRYGLFFEELEINLEGNYQNQTIESRTPFFEIDDKRSYFRHLTLGAKYLIYDPYKDPEFDKPNLYSWKANQGFNWKHLIPAVSIFAGVNYDSKENPYTSPETEGASAKVSVGTQHNFNGGWVVVMNLIRDRIGTDDSGLEFLATVTHSLNKKWAVFGEYHGIDTDYYADNLWRVGGAHLWNKNLQLDTSLTFNSKDTPSVFYIKFGVSYRIDKHKDKLDTENLETQF